eukprot:1720575-Amphidinium_carterae.2
MDIVEQPTGIASVAEAVPVDADAETVPGHPVKQVLGVFWGRALAPPYCSATATCTKRAIAAATNSIQLQ